MIEDHGIVAPDWSATRCSEATPRSVAAVGGAIENGVDRPLNWAVYFCDFLRYQSPLPEGETAIVSDANVAYKRTALESIRPIWQEIFHEASVNGGIALAESESVARAGRRAPSAPPGAAGELALRERFVWGRSYAATRPRLAHLPQRVFWAVFAPAFPS